MFIYGAFLRVYNVYTELFYECAMSIRSFPTSVQCLYGAGRLRAAGPCVLYTTVVQQPWGHIDQQEMGGPNGKTDRQGQGRKRQTDRVKYRQKDSEFLYYIHKLTDFRMGTIVWVIILQIKYIIYTYKNSLLIFLGFLFAST